MSKLLISVFLAISLIGGTTKLAAQERLSTDIVLIIDVSDSMNETLPFPVSRELKYRELTSRLWNFVINELQNGEKVIVVTLSKTPEVIVPLSARRTELATKLAELGPNTRRGPDTDIAKALGLAIDELAKLKKDRPRNQRLLFLITDGVQTEGYHPDEPLKEKQRKVKKLFDDLLFRVGGRQFRGEPSDNLNPEVAPGTDFFFWYAHIGDPNSWPEYFSTRLLDADGNPAGSSKLLDASWELRHARLSRANINFKAAAPGRKLRLKPSEPVTFEGTQETKLKLGAPKLKAGPDGASVSFAGKTEFLAEGGSRPIPLNLELIVERLPPGKYRGSIPLMSQDFSIINPRSLEFEIEIPDAQVDVVEDKLSLAPITIKKNAVETLTLIPNKVAANLAPKTQIAFVHDQETFPTGLSFALKSSSSPNSAPVPGSLGQDKKQIIFPSFELTRRTTLTLEAKLDRSANANIGEFSGKLFVRTTPSLPVPPSAIPFTCRIEAAKIKHEAALTSIKPNADGSFETKMTIQAGELDSDESITIQVGESPQSDQVAIQTTELRLSGNNPSGTINGKLKSGTAATINLQIPLSITSPMYELSPPSLAKTLVVSKTENKWTLEPSDIEYDPDTQGAPELEFTFDANTLPADEEILVELEAEPSAGSPSISLLKKTLRVSKAKAKHKVRFQFAGGLLPGTHVYTIRGTSGSLELQSKTITVKLPTVAGITITDHIRPSGRLSASSRSWPFSFVAKFPATDESTKLAARYNEFKFRFSLPGQEPIDGVIPPLKIVSVPPAGNTEASGNQSNKPTQLVLKSPQFLASLASVPVGDGQITFELVVPADSPGGEPGVIDWQRAVTVSSHSVEPKVTEVIDGKNVPVESSGDDIILDAPVQLNVRVVEQGDSEQLANQWGEPETSVLVIRDLDPDVKSGPVKVNDLNEWLKLAKSGAASVQKIPWKATSLPLIEPENKEDFFAVLVISEYIGMSAEPAAETTFVECSDLQVFDIVVPGPPSPLAFIIPLLLVIATAVGGWLGFAGWKRGQVPQLADCKFNIQPNKNCVPPTTFKDHPSFALKRWFLPYRMARFEITRSSDRKLLTIAGRITESGSLKIESAQGGEDQELSFESSSRPKNAEEITIDRDGSLARMTLTWTPPE